MANNVRDIVADMFDLERDNVLCGNGSDELLGLAVRAFVGEKQRIAYPVPTYSLYEVLADIQWADIVPLETGPNFELPLVQMAETKARMMFVCNPNAPTGVFVSPDDLHRLAYDFKGVVAIDEAYVDFASDNAIRLIKDLYNVLVFRTLSKSYSLAGLRFGYVVGQKALIMGLQKVKDSYNTDAVSIEVAAAALQDQEWMRANVEKIRAERDRLAARLDALGFDVTPSEANFLLARVPDSGAEACYEWLKARGILVRYWNLPRLADKVRITVGTPGQNDALLAALEKRCEETSA